VGCEKVATVLILAALVIATGQLSEFMRNEVSDVCSFFLGMALTLLRSSYYHQHPTNALLVCNGLGGRSRLVLGSAEHIPRAAGSRKVTGFYRRVALRLDWKVQGCFRVSASPQGVPE